MSTQLSRNDPKYERAYDRSILRSAFVSLFWAIISDRKKRNGFTLVQLAKTMGANKAEITRWFKGDPNWTLNTVASIASALDVELEVRARDRTTGAVFTPAGAVTEVPVPAIAIPDQIAPTSTRSLAQPTREVGAFKAAEIETGRQMALSLQISPPRSRVAA
jgi:transcriptional regulator with XRE-family HTH domain